MIPELRTPASRRSKYASAFQRGSSERPLRLLVDWDTVTPGPVAEVLEELSRNPNIEVFGLRASDDPRVEFFCDGDPALPEAARITRRASDDVSVFTLLEHRTHLDAASSLDSLNARDRRLLETRLAVLCERACMDALVTQSPALLRQQPGVFLYGAPNVLAPPEAVALAGLFLRSRGEFSRTLSANVSETAIPMEFSVEGRAWTSR